MRVSSVLGAAAVLSGAAAEVLQGFNCGATTDTGATKVQADFEKEFETSQNLEGAPGTFNAIRLYTNIQAGTTDTPIEAFAAAISKQTKLLLGVWSSGTDNIDNELKALSAAVEKYGTKLTDLIVALSIGSEDLYRDSEAGRRATAGVGNDAANIVKFIKDARSKLSGTPLANVPITHVDTWNAWVNGSNQVVIDEIDFLSVNAFPFYEAENDNRVSNAGKLINTAISKTEAVAGGKEVWLTETGWAYTGPSFGAGVASVDNAEAYWKDVGCSLFGKRNAFWYTLRDANPANEVKFAITDNLSTTPRFDLSCDKDSSHNSTSSDSDSNGSSSGSGSHSGSGSNGSSSGSGSGSNGGSNGSGSSGSNGSSSGSGSSGSGSSGSGSSSSGSGSGSYGSGSGSNSGSYGTGSGASGSGSNSGSYGTGSGSSTGGAGSNGSGPGSSSNSTGYAPGYGVNGTAGAGGNGTWSVGGNGTNGTVHMGTATNSAGLPESTGAGAILSVNSMAVFLSGAFALAAWAL